MLELCGPSGQNCGRCDEEAGWILHKGFGAAQPVANSLTRQ